MADDKLKISWTDLSDKKVDAKLAERDAVSGTQNHYESARIADVPKKFRPFAFLYNTILYLSLFGALGGVLGWAMGQALNQTGQTRYNEALVFMNQYDEKQQDRTLTPDKKEAVLRNMRERNSANPYIGIQFDSTKTDDQKERETTKLREQDKWRDFIAHLFFFSISGLTIAALLAMADSVMNRDINASIVYGSIGALIGAVGGVCVAIVISRIEQQIIPENDVVTPFKRMLFHTISWGTLGLFLAATPGLVLRNSKRLFIGMLGGLLGGIIGGLIFVPVQDALDNDRIANLVAIVSIGLFAGLACGIIENVAKAGWIKVKEGLIAGKQFVLYRNPTFIGSAPLSHIYLFNDPLVGRRHACVHIVAGKFEIEDLPLGSKTYVNGKPVTRTRLKNGDQIQVGSTVFLFQERNKTV